MTLLAVGTAVVAGALAAGSLILLSIAAVLGMGLAWAALRIMWTEVLQSRRDNAADRAAIAVAYRTLFEERAAEHATFTSAMTKRVNDLQAELGRINHEVDGLQRELVSAQADHAATKHELSQRLRALNLKTSQVEALEVELSTARAAAEAAREAASQWRTQRTRSA